MLTETKTLNPQPKLPARATGTLERSSLPESAVGFVPFAAIVAQFGLLVLIIHQWQLESLSLDQVMQLALVGFIIHHLLPTRFRLPFFALLSVGLTVTVIGQLGPKTWVAALTGSMSLNNFLYHLAPGLTLIVIGVGLVGLCHLPIRFSARVGLVVIVGTVLAVLRVNKQWFPDVSAMWVIFGSMFMFRLMIYLYDLRHRTASFSPAKSLCYFFMVPNVCFPLFPVVDYKTFSATYYNDKPSSIYQTGLKWMMRGVIQLLLYRLVYHFAPLDVSNLTSALDAVGFMVGMYLVYLRVSGNFHLIVGLLHMFGFNLPETHHLYFLATSFTDLWRRINIYWKDFVMKLFFYPVHFRLRKMGTLQAMTIATLVTFLATWLLHSWQWFWIRGTPLLSWKDFGFWVILAVLVLANALQEATAGRQRTLTPSRVTFRQRLRLGLQAAVVFSLMCALWTFWTCQSWAEFQTLLDALSRPTLRDFAIVIAGLAVICVSSMLWGRSNRESSEGQATHADRQPFFFWHSAGLVTGTAVFILVLPSVVTKTIPRAQKLMALIHTDTLNARDLKQERRGYYEELDVGRMDNWRSRWSRAGMAEGWGEGKKMFYRQRPDFLLSEIVPSASTVLGGAPIESNQFGMRDRDYEKAKPAGTYRIVLVGASHDQGTGVPENQTYENLVEDRLNKELPDSRYSHYEILNMSVGGYGILQRLLRLEQDGFAFQPDAAILSVAAADQQFLIEHLRKALNQGIEPPPEYRDIFDQVIHQAGVHKNMPDMMIERRLQPYVGEVYAWTFHRFAKVCADRGVRPLIIYRPAPVDLDGLEPTGRSEITRLAKDAGLQMIDLSPAFDSVTNRDTLMIANWDQHTTALGHKLLAEKLYQDLTPLLFGSSKQ